MNKCETLLIVALIVASRATQLTVEFEFADNGAQRQQIADEANKTRDMAIKLIYGDRPERYAEPFSYVEDLFVNVHRLIKGNDFGPAGKEVIQKIKLEMEQTDQKVKTLSASISQEIITLQKAVEEVLYLKSSMGNASHFLGQNEAKAIEDIKKHITDMEHHMTRLGSLSQEYSDDKGRASFNIHKGDDRMRNWDDVVQFYVSEKSFYLPDYGFSTIRNISQSAKELRKIREAIRDGIKQRQQSSFWFTRWWWNSNAKFAETALSSLDAVIASTTKLEETQTKMDALKADYQNFVRQTNKDLPDKLLESYQYIEREITTKVTKIKASIQQIALKYKNGSQQWEDLGKYIMNTLQDFVNRIDNMIIHEGLHWLTLDNKISDAALLVFSNESYYVDHAPQTVVLDQIVIKVDGVEEDKYAKQLTFDKPECKLFYSFCNTDDKEPITLGNKVLTYVDSKLPFQNREARAMTFSEEFVSRAPPKFLESVDQLAKKDGVFKAMRCELYVLDYDVRLVINLEDEQGEVFNIKRQPIQHRLVV